MNDASRPEASEGPQAFATTHWSVVLLAGRNDTTRARDALARLCETYWYPLYAYVRRSGYRVEEAQDLTQEFFARLLARDDLARVAPERGRFRSFLLASLKHFLINEWKRAHRLKRGGSGAALSLDAQAGEARYAGEPASDLTAERIYERRWALTLLERALARLEQEHSAPPKRRLFTHLKPTLAGERAGASYAVIGAELGLSEAAVKMAVTRLRRRYREIVREEIGQTVASPREVDDEIRHLFQALE